MLIDFLDVFLGAIMHFCPAQYSEIVLAVSAPVLTIATMIFIFWLSGYFAKTMIYVLGGRD